MTACNGLVFQGIIQTEYLMRMTEQADLEILAAGRFMRMVKRGRWEYVQRHNAEGAVAIIATHRPLDEP